MAGVLDKLAGRYELADVLGRGGMGVVYRAKDRVLDRSVAVKILPLDRAEDPTSVTRFEREARALAGLSHPNIVAVYDTGVDDEVRFIVMEYVAGDSLAELVRQRGRLPAAEVISIGTQIASAIAAAHRAGIVHRDIKPANVMLDEHHTVKVLDFGIARASAATSLTQTAMVLGSAPYLAPEVSRGLPADSRSDIYALGCVLYELLTGRPPFKGDLPAAILHQHNTAHPPAPRELAPEVPPGLSALVLKMLAKDPDQRPQDAAQLVNALPASISATGAATVPLPRPSRSRLPSTRVLGLALGVLLLVLLAILLLQGSSSPRRAASTQTQTTHTTPPQTRPTTPRTASTPTPRTVRRTAPRPLTVGQAAGALTTLATQDLQRGLIDPPAAQQIVSHLQDILNSYDGGNPADALHHVQDLTSQISQLSSHGDIRAAALPGINAAVDRLSSALQRAVATTATTPSQGGPVASPGPPPKHKNPHPPKPPH